MAKTSIKRVGYGQVEPNHLSGIVTGQIYAQLPCAEGITQLEQGQFAIYDYAKGVVDFDGDGEPMLVYNEEKLYDERFQSHKDFVYKASDFTDKQLYPRLIKTNVGDIFTTNSILKANTSNTDTVYGNDLDVGDILYYEPKAVDDYKGFLRIWSETSGLSGLAGKMAWKVVKVYTMPDGQLGVKIQRIQ